MKKDIFIAIVVIGALLSPVYLLSSGKAIAEDSKIPFPAVKSQFFCGYCHVLTYPRVMKKAYTSWKAGKHKDIGCVECHYPPDRLYSEIPQHRKIPKDERFSPNNHFKYGRFRSQEKAQDRRPELYNCQMSSCNRHRKRGKILDKENRLYPIRKSRQD